MLEVRQLSVSRGAKAVLNDISFTLAKGESLAVVGPNGAGKSSLVKAIVGLVTIKRGHILVDGQSLQDLNRRHIAQKIAIVDQSSNLPQDFRVAEMIAMGRHPHRGLFAALSADDKAIIHQASRDCGLEPLLDRPVAKLSGGEKQRVLFARALSQTSDYLLLDEPTNHLDLKYQIELLQLARQQCRARKAVLMVLHDLNLAARFCDAVMVLDQGRMVAYGRPGEVLERHKLEHIYQTDIDVFAAPSDKRPVVLPRVS